jgi:predicted RNA-binding protein with PIN domain
MALHYIIDGYNVLKQLSNITKIKVSTKAEGLVSFLFSYHPQGSKRNKVTIIFDGYGEINSQFREKGINVIYSKKISADDYIISYIKKMGRITNIKMVSDDRELRYRAKILGAKVVNVDEFLKPVVKKKEKRKAIREDKPSLYSKKAQEITSYLEKIWLRKNS